jgi:type I restriction enzyme M protein
MSQQNLSSFIWSVADLLRGDYKQSEYGRVEPQFVDAVRGDLRLKDSSPVRDAGMRIK